MSNFYVTLLSNSSMNIYPENKTSGFTVQIPRNVILTSDWEVALAEIQYPYSFFTVQKGENFLEIKTFVQTKEYVQSDGKTLPTAQSVGKTLSTTQSDGKTLPTTQSTPPSIFTWSLLEITPGFYNDIKELISAVNSAIGKKTKQTDFFQFDEKSKRISTKAYKLLEGAMRIASFKLHGRLALQLGFSPESEFSTGVKAQHVANISIGVPDIMLIYCDILEPQIVGDTCVRLLRAINTTNDAATYFSKPCSIEFAQPQYIPIQKKYFDSIQIDIRDVAGRPMPFQYGTLRVKLHFKKKN